MNFDQITLKEQRQMKAGYSCFQGEVSDAQLRAASKRRKKIMESRILIESGLDQEQELY